MISTLAAAISQLNGKKPTMRCPRKSLYHHLHRATLELIIVSLYHHLHRATLELIIVVPEVLTEVIRLMI